MVPLSKSGVRKHRGFESRPLRHRSPRGSVQAGVGGSAPSLTHPRVRSLGCSLPPWPERDDEASSPRASPPARGPRPTAGPVPAPAAHRASRRGRLVDYGAALEMRFAATRRGFESPPLRHSPASGTRPLASAVVGCRYTWTCRARRGTSGALYLQSAPAGLNSLSRPLRAEAAIPDDVEDRVPRSGDSRTVSGPEGSSTQRSSPGAAERPGPSRLRWWARARLGRQGVHGILIEQAARPRGAA